MSPAWGWTFSEQMAVTSLQLRLAQRRLGLSIAIGRCSSQGSSPSATPSPKRPHVNVNVASGPSSSPFAAHAPHSHRRGASSVPSSSRSFSASRPAEAQQPESRLPRDFLSTLRKRLPSLRVSTNPYDLDSHGRGESYHPTRPPDAVVYPTSAEEISIILGLCCREREAGAGGGASTVEIVSIIPYGAGTSVEGHLQFLFPPSDDEEEDGDHGKIVEIPSSRFAGRENEVNSYRKVRVQRKGGISIDMGNFQSIGEVEPGDNHVVVGAGVTRNTLNESLRHTGMQFMVDPGADATIGGMTACGASGTSAVKYGTMRENVLAMTAVLPPTSVLPAKGNQYNTKPDVVRLGCNALKSSAGYDLPAMLTGSEGTLGVMTEVAVRLHPVPSHVVAASCAFADLHSAAEAVAMIRMMGVPVSRIELLDETSIRAFNRTLRGEECDGGGRAGGDDELRLRPMEAKPTLFMEFAGHSESAALEDLNAARSVCMNEYEGANFASASDESTRHALWAARHRLYYSSIALRAGSGEDDEGATPQSTVLTDACVPLSHFADIISATARDVQEKGVIGPCFGHAGDGNFHCILPMKKNDTAEYRDNVFRVVENLTERAISVGGTCTGEHGVGYGKKKYLKRQHGEGGVGMMRAVKQSLDPWNILNPGKIVDHDFYGTFG